MQIAACLTTRNEAASIGKIVRELVGWEWGVYICDADSDDETPDIAQAEGATVQWNVHRVPMAEGYRRAWQMALNAGADILIQLDAGDSHDPLNAFGLVYALEAEADVALGSRFCKGARYIGNPKRAQMSKFATAVLNLTQPGARYTDWTSGYRGFTKRAAEMLLKKRYRAQGHAWQIEVLAHAGALGLKVEEAPITYKAGRSSFNRKSAWEAFVIWTHVVNHIGGRKENITYGSETNQSASGLV